MDNWIEKKSLEELVKSNTIKLDRGRVISSIDLATKIGEYPVYSSSAQNNGHFGSYGLYDFEEELITWSVDGGGYFFYRPKHKFSVTNVSGILRILNTEKINYKFLYYLFCFQHSNQIFDYVDKAHPSVIKKRYFVPIIDIFEQQSIANILSKTDQAIANTEALIAKYTKIKTGLMQDLLTKGIDENGNIRSEQTHEFKDSPLGRLPKEWECDKLISFCQKIQDGTHFSPKTDVNGKYKYITSKNIRMGFIDLSNLEFLNEKAHNLIYKRCSVEFGDVLLTKDGASTGNICINSLNEEFSLLSSVALIRGKKKVLKNEFIFQFFMEENGQKSLIEQMSGNAITRITLTKINNTFIKVPPFDEQEVIIKKLKPQDELINQERIKLSKLQSIKTGLMQDLLSGKVGVKIL
jgi:type I restriction enzyme S subunit